MTSADVFRVLIIIGLGILSFITFLVAGTILGLMWLDAWSCGSCHRYPVGLYILGLFGILSLISIGYEVSDAQAKWHEWIKANRSTVAVIVISVVTFFFLLNWWWWF